MNKRDITRLVEGQLTGGKKEAVIDWLLKNPKEQEYYQILKAQYVAKSLSNSKIVTRKPGRLTTQKAIIYKYAAVFVLLLVSSFVVWQQIENIEKDTNATILLATTAIGENKKVELPDGTLVVLNANTILSYPSKFSGKIRAVVLKGEAFFDVKENKDKPFIVNTDNDLRIRVLGTSFNVKAYPGDDDIETILVSGKVRVIEKKDNKEVVLKPSQRATFKKKADKIIVDNVKARNFTAWKEGVLVYDETPMNQVISDLKRAYDISVVISSPDISTYKYTGVFDNLTIVEVLDLFEISSPITYKLNNKQVTLGIKK